MKKEDVSLYMARPMVRLAGMSKFAVMSTLLWAALVVIYCIWSLDRGFEITDEAYYLLLAQHADTTKFYVSAQHWMMNWLWQLTGSLVMFRASGLILLLLTSTILAMGIIAISKRSNILEDGFAAKSAVIGGSIIGGLFYASTINLSPCYNLLASAGAYGAAGLVFMGVRHPNLAYKYIYYVLAGCFIGAEALSKASAGVATFVFLIAWIFIFDRTKFHKITGIFLMLVGVLAFSLVALLSNTTIDDAVWATEQGLALFRIVQSEGIGARLLRYATQFGQNIFTTFVSFIFPLLLWGLYIKTRRLISAWLGLLALIVILLWGRHWLGGWNDDLSLNPPFAIVAMLAMAIMVSISVWKKNRDFILLIIGLVLLPYSVAVGTGNTLFTQIVVSLAPWGGLVGLLMVLKFAGGAHKLPMALIGLLFVATIALQLITSGFRPYQLSGTLMEQNHPIRIGNLGIVKVDAKTHQFLSDMGAAAKNCDIAPGMPFLGLYNIPGIALVLEANPIASPWLNNLAQADFVLDRTPPEELQTVILAVNKGSGGDLPPLPKYLKAFPAGFKYCGSATYPYISRKIEIWRQGS